MEAARQKCESIKGKFFQLTKEANDAIKSHAGRARVEQLVKELKETQGQYDSNSRKLVKYTGHDESASADTVDSQEVFDREIQRVEQWLRDTPGSSQSEVSETDQSSDISNTSQISTSERDELMQLRRERIAWQESQRTRQPSPQRDDRMTSPSVSENGSRHNATPPVTQVTQGNAMAATSQNAPVASSAPLSSSLFTSATVATTSTSQINQSQPAAMPSSQPSITQNAPISSIQPPIQQSAPLPYPPMMHSAHVPQYVPYYPAHPITHSAPVPQYVQYHPYAQPPHADQYQAMRNLPRPGIESFDGNPAEYSKFIQSFDINIAGKIANNSERLNYLQQFCKGRAGECISACHLLPPDQGYKHAREQLRLRFGQPYMVNRSHIEKLINGPVIRPNDTDALSDLSIAMDNCQTVLQSLGYASDIDNSDNLVKIVRRLPYHLKIKWADKASSIYELGREANFSDLNRFVQGRVNVAISMFGRELLKENDKPSHKPQTKHSSGNNGSRKVTTLSTHSEPPKNDRHKCVCCDGNCKTVNECKKFKGMPMNERSRFVKQNRLCFNCLRGNHFVGDCRAKPCRTCERKTSELLHNHEPKPRRESDVSVAVNCAATRANKGPSCFLGIIPVYVTFSDGQRCRVYALLDNGSTRTLCDERLLNRLNVKGRPVDYSMETINCETSEKNRVALDLTINGMDGGEVNIRDAYSVKRLPIRTQSAATPEDLKRYSHLSDVRVNSVDSDRVLLLIGADATGAHVPLECRSGADDEPYAIRTRLGWAVRGPAEKEPTRAVTTNHQIVVDLLTESIERLWTTDFIDAIEGEQPIDQETEPESINFHRIADPLIEKVERMWKTDFSDVAVYEKPAPSVEDKEALKMMQESIKLEDGHYKVSLPWRDENTVLPNNISMAHARLNQLKRKLQKDENLHDMYTATMKDYIDKGYARQVPKQEAGKSKRTWYLPHHPVTNVNKPGKVRVVFDCAAKYNGTSLNENLMQGPDLMNSLIGVLIRFRQSHIAIAADIEAMFHQVKLHENDWSAQRFLWYPDGDLTQEPVEYCMTVTIFGARPSPSSSNQAVLKTVDDNKADFNDSVASTVKENFYVDDLLKSVDTPTEATGLARDVTALLARGGFRLTKWISNNREVLDSIQEEERAASVKHLDLDDELPCDRALGVQWNVEDDALIFNVDLKEKSTTRRGILSVVCSLFDPCGLVAPVIMCAKLLLQKLCCDDLSWDDPISDDDAATWRSWLNNLPSLRNLRIPRCFKSSNQTCVKRAELHVFSDASEKGYGACAYIRYVYADDTPSCTLVMGKSRVAPTPQQSVPRLELTAALVACRLQQMLVEEIQVKFDNIVLWTDSTIVLSYIQNKTRRFKTFVANRLSIIHSCTSIKQWRHVPGTENPADLASRGIDATDDTQLARWISGPQFLLKSEDQWPGGATTTDDVADDDVEVKRAIVNAIDVPDAGINMLIEKYSSWTRLARATAWVIRFQMYCRRKYLKHDVALQTSDLSLDELRRAESAVVSQVQHQCFLKEMKKLGAGEPVGLDSKLRDLHPVVHDGVIRVGGRLQNSHAPADAKQPIILPADHHVTRVLIRHYHASKRHLGVNDVLAAMRTRYWVIHGVSAIKREISQCVSCKRHHGPLCQQLMAPLPEERLIPDQPPFTNVGVDYFGPLYVKVGRAHHKRYGCLFTCLATRAVHIEIAHSLTTDSFLSALRRFGSRRGQPAKVFSDNGTNLAGGEREIRESMNEWNQRHIRRELQNRDIEWHFNPPHASHMGGVWERMVRSVKSILKATVKTRTLNDEELLTFTTEAEAIINDRPITAVSNDARDPEPLTPSMLLLFKSNRCLPPGVFSKDDEYAKRRWRQVQYLANEFWKRWMKEYLPALQVREKWQRPHVNVKVGDIVLVADENTPRGQWPMGLVRNVNVGRDGYVRSCTVKCGATELVRPIVKLCLLESSD